MHVLWRRGNLAIANRDKWYALPSYAKRKKSLRNRKKSNKTVINIIVRREKSTIKNKHKNFK